MFRTVFPSIIRSSRLYVQQKSYVKQILLLLAGYCYCLLLADTATACWILLLLAASRYCYYLLDTVTACC